MIDRIELTYEELEVLRVKAIENAMSKFGWSLERCERVLGKNTGEFKNRVKLVDNKDYSNDKE